MRITQIRWCWRSLILCITLFVFMVRLVIFSPMHYKARIVEVSEDSPEPAGAFSILLTAADCALGI